MPFRKERLSPKFSLPYRGVYLVQEVHSGAQNVKVQAYGKEDAPSLQVNIRRLKLLVSDFPALTERETCWRHNRKGTCS